MQGFMESVAEMWQRCWILQATHAAAPHEDRVADISDPIWLAERLEQVETRWNTNVRATLGTLWWFDASRLFVGLALASSLTTDTMIVPAVNDAISLDEQGYIQGWKTSKRAPRRQGYEALTVALDEMIESLAEACRRRPAPLWAIAGDAAGLATRIFSANIAPEHRRRLWSHLEEFHATWAKSAPISPLELVPELLEPDAPIMSASVGEFPPEQPWRRHSCCLMYRTPDNSYCDNCPKLRSKGRRVHHGSQA